MRDVSFWKYREWRRKRNAPGGHGEGNFGLKLGWSLGQVARWEVLGVGAGEADDLVEAPEDVDLELLDFRLAGEWGLGPKVVTERLRNNLRDNL